ncbi:hypothetical protein [Paenibacillus sp. YIM B09110]|uniref:hypothetical protein n=1 Tax=Paenibacillus sp. YIM B09110 TaxID=3126102 RepID=UPI00301D5D60
MMQTLLPGAGNTAYAEGAEETNQNENYVTRTDTHGNLFAQRADIAGQDEYDLENRQSDLQTSTTNNLTSNVERSPYEVKTDADGQTYSVPISHGSIITTTATDNDQMLQPTIEQIQQPQPEMDYTISDENGVRVARKVSSASLSLENESSSTGVDLLIKGARNPYVHANVYVLQETGYNMLLNEPYELESTDEGLIVHFPNLDWDKWDKFFIVGQIVSDTRNHFVQMVESKDAGTSITIDPSLFSSIHAELPAVNEGWEDDHLAFTLTDEYGVAVTAIELSQGDLLSPGLYNVQFNAQGDDTSYLLFKKNITVGGNETTVTFEQDEISRIPVTPEGSGLKLSSFFSIYWEGYNSIRAANAEGKQYIGVSQFIYESIDMQYLSESGYSYGFYKAKFNPATTPSLAIDLNLNMTINPYETEFMPGEEFYNELEIRDGLRLMTLNDLTDQHGNQVPVQIIFSKNDTIYSEIMSSRYYPIVKLPVDPGSYEMTIKLSDDLPITASATKLITILAPDLSFIIPDNSGDFHVNNVSLSMRNNWGTSTDYGYDGQSVSYVAVQTDQGIRISTYTNLDKCNECYVKIETNKHNIIQQVSVTDKGIPILVDLEELVPLTISVPYADESFETNSVVLTYLDENQKMISFTESSNNLLTTPGHYNIQINGFDNSHAYMLFKQNVSLSERSHSIMFPKSEASNLHFQMDNQLLNTQYLYPSFSNSAVYGLNLEGRKDVYLTNNDYWLFMNFEDEENWQYYYEKPEADIHHDQVLSYDTSYSIKTNLEKTHYVSEILYDNEISVVDQYGNWLAQIYNSRLDKSPAFQAEFEDESGHVSTQSVPLSYLNIEVPDQLGRNQLTLSVNDSPIAIQPATAELVIKAFGQSMLRFFIPDEEITQADAVYAYSKEYESGYSLENTTITPVDGGTIIGINHEIWNEDAEQFMAISTNKYMFRVPISEEQIGEIIPIDTSSFVPVTTTIASTGKGFQINTQTFNFLDTLGRPVAALNVYPDAKIQQGVYNVQVNAQDDDKAYMLFKNNVVAGTAGANIVFQKSEMALLKPQMADKNMQVEWFAALNSDTFMTIYYLRLDKLKPIYLSKDNYNFNFLFKNSDWTYGYNSKSIDLTKDLTLNMDTKLKAKLSLRNKYYDPREYLEYPDFNYVYDSYNNRLDELHSPAYESFITYEYKNRSTGEMITLREDYLGSLRFPEQEGVYDLTYRVGGPVKVTPATAIIKVGEGPAVTKLTVSKPSLTLEGVGAFSKITVMAYYADGTKRDIIYDGRWSSDNDQVAEGDYFGQILARGVGKANITVSYKGKSLTIPVTVIEKQPVKLTASTTKVLVRPGAEKVVKLTATFKDKTQEEVTSSANWSSSKPEIAEMVDGKLVIHDYGQTVLTAEFRGKRATISVDSSVRSLTVGTSSKQSSVKSVSLLPGDELQLIAKGVFSDNSKAEGVSHMATWSVSDPSVLSVEAGKVRVKQFGTATVTAKLGQKSVMITINANVNRMTALIANKAITKPVIMKLGEKKQMTLSAALTSGTRDVTNAAKWTLVSDTSGGTITVNKGLIEANGIGKATVTAEYGGKIVTIVIDTTVKSIVTDKKNVSLKIGKTQKVKLTATMADNSKIDVTGLALWSSAAPETATIANGIITLHKIGQTTISGTYGGQTVTMTVVGTK